MRWSQKHTKEIATPFVDLFLADIERVCKFHGYAIGHEDGHGGFIIDDYAKGAPSWIQDASIGDVGAP